MIEYDLNIKIERIINGEIETNTYIISSFKTSNCVIIDPADFRIIDEYIMKEKLNPLYIINTHGHYDHISANREIKDKYNSKICIGYFDKNMLIDPMLNLSYFLEEDYKSYKADVCLFEDKKLRFDDIDINIYETPGHTKGSISLGIKNMFFTGDLIFTNGIGRIDLPTGNADEIMRSIRMLFEKLKYDDMIFPGHGDFGKKGIFSDIFENVLK